MGQKPVNIVTVLWEGSFRGRDYCPEDVSNLRRMVLKALSRHNPRFYCLTNSRTFLDGVQMIKLKCPDQLIGWWSKLELFRKDITFWKNETGVYLDLDTFVTGDLSEMIDFVNDFNSYDLFFCPQKWGASGPGVVRKFQSSMIIWKQGSVFINIDKLMEGDYYKKVLNRYRGDQDFFGVVFGNKADSFPEEWFCKLKECYKHGPNPPVKVVLGNPKTQYRKAFEECDWVKELIQC